MEEVAIPKVTSEDFILPGYERLAKRSETRRLRLNPGEQIELIMGKGHIIRLRRGIDYVVRISMDGFQLPDSETDALSDEVKLPANASVDIRRNSALADNKLGLKRIESYDEFMKRRVVDYHINFPNMAVNLQDQNIDFTDIEDGHFAGLSILLGVAGRRAEDNMIFITNHDGRFRVGVPEKSLRREGAG